jgi:glutamyl-tRNA reductase
MILKKKLPVFFVTGINHRSAPVDIREKFHVSYEDLPKLLDHFKVILPECMILSTCNRTELYGVIDNDEQKIEEIKKIFIEFLNLGYSENKKYFYDYVLNDAAHHLFKVVSSIDSMIKGDTQIMCQVKKAYEAALVNNSTGKILNQLIQKALHTAKRAKHETSLFKGAYSVSYAAVEMGVKIFGKLDNKKVLVIGAGKTAELTVNNLIKKNVKDIYVTNRTRSNAENLVNKINYCFGINTGLIEYEKFKERLDQFDIIISSTGSGNYILNYDEFNKIYRIRNNEPVLIIDIAVPRDMDPEINNIGNVHLKNIDDLKTIIDSNYENRISSLPEVNKIISEEVIEFFTWYYTLPIVPAIQFIRENLNGQATNEIKMIRNFISENVLEVEKNRLVSGASDLNIIIKHDRFLSDLHLINEKAIKSFFETSCETSC